MLYGLTGPWLISLRLPARLPQAEASASLCFGRGGLAGWGGASPDAGRQEQGRCPIASFSQAAAQLMVSGHACRHTFALRRMHLARRSDPRPRASCPPQARSLGRWQEGSLVSEGARTGFQMGRGL